MKKFAKFVATTQKKNEILCIVEDVRDVMAIENTSKFNGKYLVLGGKFHQWKEFQINSIFLLLKKN